MSLLLPPALLGLQDRIPRVEAWRDKMRGKVFRAGHEEKLAAFFQVPHPTVVLVSLTHPLPLPVPVSKILF